jgi:hypothetical protein
MSVLTGLWRVSLAHHLAQAAGPSRRNLLPRSARCSWSMAASRCGERQPGVRTRSPDQDTATASRIVARRTTKVAERTMVLALGRRISAFMFFAFFVRTLRVGQGINLLTHSIYLEYIVFSITIRLSVDLPIFISPAFVPIDCLPALLSAPCGDDRGERAEAAPIIGEVDNPTLKSHRRRTIFIASIDGKTTWLGADKILAVAEDLLT